MSSFDVFIRGIRPERLDDAEQIKKKASQFFKIEEQQLEASWSVPGGLCIRRNINGEEAEKLQTTLAKGGLICIYRPAKTGVGLSLVSEDKESTDRIFTCPSCKHEITLKEGETDPVKCSKCFITIASYLDKLKQKQEREEIKNRLLRSKTSTELREMELQKEEAERKRKQKLEEEIRDELYGTQRKKLRNRLILAASTAVILVSTGIGFAYLGKNDKQLTVTISGDDLPTVEVAAHSNEGQQSLQDEMGEQSPGQKAMQDVHDKANKVLGGFGLDADKLAENTGKTTSKSTAKLSSVSPSTDTKNPQTSPEQVKDQTITATSSLLLTTENTQEFDLMVNQGVISLINRNFYDEAYQLGQYLIDTEVYINAMGRLLAFVQHEKKSGLANEIIAAVETRINSLPVAEQAAYFAQAGFYQTHIMKSTVLFNRADKTWEQLTHPEEQLTSAVTMAAYYFKVDNIDAANHYFEQINPLLDKIQSPEQQVIARIAIAKAYHQVSNDVSAANWLASTDKFIPQISSETFKVLVEAYASINQFQLAITRHVSAEKQDELLYLAVKASLKSNLINNAMTINDSIQEPGYKILAYDLIASYDPNTATQSLALAEQLVQNIDSPADKAIAASRLSRHYARIANSQKATELFTLAEQQINALPESPSKDDVIAVIAKNYAQSLQFETANKLISAIKSEAVKVAVNNELVKLMKMGALLTLSA